MKWLGLILRAFFPGPTEVDNFFISVAYNPKKHDGLEPSALEPSALGLRR